MTEKRTDRQQRARQIPRGQNGYRFAKKPSILTDILQATGGTLVDWVPPRPRSRKLEQHRRPSDRIIRRMPKLGNRLKDKMLKVMKPGEWYAQGDVVRAATGTRGRRCSAHRFPFVRMFRDGMLERVKNAKWDPTPRSPQFCAQYSREPQWLYRITAAGAASRSVIMLLG